MMGVLREKFGGTCSSTKTCEKGRDAICSISTKSRCLRRYRSYFCLIFHMIAATRSNEMKQAENVMKNCCSSNLGCWLKETYAAKDINH